MSFKILVVEDTAEIRGIVCDHLVPRLKNAPVGAWHNGWTLLADTPFEILPCSPGESGRLADPMNDEELWAFLQEACPQILQADAAVLDMALTDPETRRLESAGGTDHTGELNPLEELKRTTGYRMLLALRSSVPVVATTFASNPRVAHALLEAGANAVVTKPLKDDDMKLAYQLWKRPPSPDPDNPLYPTSEQLAAAHALGPVLETYLQTIASEVAKAVKESVLSGLRGGAPQHVPYWIASDVKSLVAQKLAGTNLLLLDVRGFSKLVELGHDKPEGVFHIMNTVWEAVISTLDKHGAEINNFIGDAAVVFRGVYGHPQEPAEIRETLACALDLCSLFERDAEFRARLNLVVESNYNVVRFGENGVYEAMRELVSSDRFGVRIVVAEPDVDEALYGRVGTDRRWQHTILSRFMNALARVETAVGNWEKDAKFPLPATGCHILMLWPSGRPRPQLANARIVEPDEFLGVSQDDLREVVKDVPRGLDIVKIERPPVRDASD